MLCGDFRNYSNVMEIPMNCERMIQLLPFLHDGSLEPPLKRDAERHLEECSKCARTYREVSSIVDLAGQVIRECPSPVGGAYLSEVRERIRKETHSRSLIRWMVPAAAALFITVSVGTYSIFLERSVQYSTAPVMNGRAPQETHAPANTANVDDSELIDAMYRYSDVTVDDILSRMNDDELQELLDSANR
jgi:hypothetical protein